jgi:sterol desaturase/sphingolipid hydroxylase (fatty acid hydroxylase superfamily)
VRWFWASHSVHHSARQLNFSASYRLGWTSGISGAWVFFLPPLWVGFSPFRVIGSLTVNLLYQFWLHTELIPSLGVVEWIFNTPSHHRVHHARNTNYLDKNYGGVLIIFDRLFGTFQVELANEPCEFGLVRGVSSLNPIRIALYETSQILHDIKASNSWSDRWFYLFGRPDWTPSNLKVLLRN